MNSDAGPTLRAAQLIYSNVEEGDSPRRRRGFQIWLQSLDSEHLPEAIRDEVESLVSGFQRPPKVAPDFVRRIFMPLSDGVRAIVAEARSNPHRDKFGREGRFHTHALIFDRAAFRTVARNDPFSIFGGGFAFQKLPDDAARSDDWKRGHIPEVDVPVAWPPPARPFPDGGAPAEVVPEDVLPLAAQWLVDERIERTSLALPFAPAAVERFLADLFGLLPIELRLSASFDTLWPGRGKYPPQIVGAGTADALALWPFRETIRYDIRRRQFQPQIGIGPNWRSALVRHWHATSTWSEADRQSSWALAEWVHGGEGRPRPDATAAALDHAGTWPQAQVRWRELVAAKCIAEFPGLLGGMGSIRVRALAYFGEWSSAGFAKLDEGIPIPIAAGWIEEALGAMPEVSEEVANAVLHWKPDRSGPEIDRLPWMAYRWIPLHVNLLHDKLLSESVPGEEWIREYCRETLPLGLRYPADVPKILHQLLWSKAPPMKLARWFVSVCGVECAISHPVDYSRLCFLLSLDPETGWEPGFRWVEVREWVLETIFSSYDKRYRAVALEVADAHPDTWAKTMGGGKTPILCIGFRIGFFGLNDNHLRLFEWFYKRDPAPMTAALQKLVSPEADLVAGGSAPGHVDEGTRDKATDLAKGKREKELTMLLKELTDIQYCKLASERALPSFNASIKVFELNRSKQFWFLGVVLRDSKEKHSAIEVTFLRALVSSELKIHRIDTDSFADAPAKPPKFLWLFREFLNRVPPTL